jgi:hypothetical protein
MTRETRSLVRLLALLACEFDRDHARMRHRIRRDAPRRLRPALGWL